VCSQHSTPWCHVKWYARLAEEELEARMTPAELGKVDVLVIGAGNAAANAALSAHEAGASVAMIETAPREARGGNSAFTGGAFRFTYSSVEDLLRLAPDIADLDLASIDFGSYTDGQYFDDMGRLTEYRCDPDLTEVLISNSFDAGLWLRKHGVRFQPALGRQAFKVDGRFKFWGGLACHILGGGQHLVAALHERLEQLGIPVLYDTTATALLHGDARVEGVRVRHGFRQHDLRAAAVVLACGGFESNPEMRARYLGPNWDLAKVRGTKYNTGNGHRMAIDIGAAVAGHWSGAHAVQWDMNAPPYGDLTVGDRFQKHNYPFGVLVNARGERFLDEGLDFHSYTYVRYGHEVMKQPGLFAW
jgi:tricarballylate dehydrogenase